MRPARSSTPALLAIAPALLLLACAAESTTTGGVTIEPLPSSTPRPFPTAGGVLGDLPTQADNEAAPGCLSPYPGEEPQGTSDDPERIRPPARPSALDRFRPAPIVTDDALEEAIVDAIGDEDEGRVSVVIKNLGDGRGVELQEEESYYAASVFKTWVMLEVFHQQHEGVLELDEQYVVSDYYAPFRLNDGELAPCEQVSVGRALERMIAISDNVAANLLLDRAGSGNINAALADVGMTNTAVPEDGSLPTTAADMALLLEAIATGEAVSGEASDAMVGLLASEAIDNRLPALLPSGTVVAHKTGNWTNATHDAGIVFSPAATYVIVVMTDFGFQDDSATLIAEISRLAYEHFNRS